MFERAHIRRDGSRFPVEIHACAVAVGEKRFILTIERDITERKKAEETVLRGKEELEWTFDAATNPIMIVGTDYRIRRANRAMAEMMGLTAGDLAGKICYEQFHKTDAPPDCPHRRLLKDCRCYSDEIFEPHLGKHLLVTVSPLFDAQGGLAGSVHFAYDITERKNMEMALSKYRKHLEIIVDQRTTELRTEIAERKRADKELRCYTTQLQELSARLVEAGEEERRAIARELHDEVGQLLTGLKMSIETVGRSPVNSQADALGRMQVIVGELLKKVRSLSLNLHPAVLDDLGLERALEHLSRHYKETSGMSVLLACDLPRDRLPRQTELAVYRVIQEALTNAVRHAGVAEAEVVIHKSNDVMTVSVIDKGTGFDAQAALGSRASVFVLGLCFVIV
jgi:PAS domain S-box-containing protein